ncbi:MAG: hypothetical protein ABUS57_14105 [Pseudomonadota bacterium]
MGLLARVLLGALTVAAAGSAAAPAWSDAPVADSGTPDTFDAAFFTQYSPNTAMDVLTHVPGFAVEDGGGAAANVLIDGRRPARSQPLNTLLSHIPAGQVVRIEVLRGAAAAAAVPGRTTVANIIRSDSAGDGLWDGGVEFAEGAASPRGSLTWNGRKGAIEYGLGATYEERDRPTTGEGETRDLDGALTETRRSTGERASRKYGFTAQASTLIGDGGRISLNGEASTSDSTQRSTSAQLDAALAPSAQKHRREDETERDYEFGASLEHDVGPWMGNLDGVFNHVTFDNIEDQDSTAIPSGDLSLENHATDRDVDGALLRGTLARELTDTQRLEIGVEHGQETVDAHRETLYSGPGWTSAHSGDVIVEQEHATAYATHLWQVAPHWSVETRIARETARLSFSDETAQSVELDYWKGSFQITREFGQRNQIRARVLRDAGHIDADHLIEALADNDTPNGIPELRPDMTWRAELNTDLRFGRRGSLGVTLSRAWIENTVDHIIVNGPSGPFDAPGNIGEAHVDALNVNLSTPIVLIPRATLSMSGGVANSEVTDPLTGKPRSLLNVADAHVWAQFRQEVPAEKFSWGLTYYQSTPGYWLQRDAIGSWEGGPSVDAFLETTAIEGVKARFRASSVLDPPARVQQLYYAPDRTGPIDHVDRDDTYSGTTFSVSLAGTF